ncbi:hypothetical protein [Ancylothrix sp. D3o]|nr:hypothetical protein [Ancylothrix sp. D3o]
MLKSSDVLDRPMPILNDRIFETGRCSMAGYFKEAGAPLERPDI